MLLLNQWSSQVGTRAGLKLNIRPASPSDRQDVLAFLGSVSPADLRFRFLSAVKPSASLARMLSDVDHQSTEDLLAFDAATGDVVASAMIAEGQEPDRAEIAILVRSDLAGRGIGWTMLEQASEYARTRGYRHLECVESAGNRRAVEIEREQGFAARPYDGAAEITILAKDLA